MIVGTAGHIDHGKTTLVRALTGVDTDRLPEERRRGISIELGFAYLDLPGVGPLGFVDVPGHERLVHTMLAGATGIDFGLLLVAADDGVMPQTVEHSTVLSLLEIADGAVVVTKADRVDRDRIDTVLGEVRTLCEGTALAHWPSCVVSAHTGAGVDALQALLARAAGQVRLHRAADAAFRLAVDRAFVLDGVGTVVTGTAHAGNVAVGDELTLLPGGTRVRVRSLHAHNRAVERAVAGQRCAVGLAGAERTEAVRGGWLVAPPAALATDRLDAALHVWRGEPRPLRSGTPIHLHLGAASVTGTVAVLDGDTIAPGGRAHVQIVLREPIGAWHGDRMVLRDASASRVIAGGTVLDPFAPARYRRVPQRRAELAALALTAPDERLQALVDCCPSGVDLARFEAAQGRAVTTAVVGALRVADGAGHRLLGATHLQEARARTLAALGAYHASHPEELGPDAARLRRLALPRLPDALWRGVLDGLVADGGLSQRGAFLFLPDHAVLLSAIEQRLAERLLPRMLESGFEGAWVRDLARDAGEPEVQTRVTLARVARRGELHQVVRDLYYPPASMQRLADLARADCAAHGEVTAARFRDATGLGRKRAIQILEYLDRIGVLRRVGDAHRERTDSTLFRRSGR